MHTSTLPFPLIIKWNIPAAAGLRAGPGALRPGARLHSVRAHQRRQGLARCCFLSGRRCLPGQQALQATAALGSLALHEFISNAPAAGPAHMCLSAVRVHAAAVHRFQDVQLPKTLPCAAFEQLFQNFNFNATVFLEPQNLDKARQVRGWGRKGGARTQTVSLGGVTATSWLGLGLIACICHTCSARSSKSLDMQMPSRTEVPSHLYLSAAHVHGAHLRCAVRAAQVLLYHLVPNVAAM